MSRMKLFMLIDLMQRKKCSVHLGEEEDEITCDKRKLRELLKTCELENAVPPPAIDGFGWLEKRSEC